jgi:lysophospholipase L1-like esterase
MPVPPVGAVSAPWRRGRGRILALLPTLLLAAATPATVARPAALPAEAADEAAAAAACPVVPVQPLVLPGFRAALRDGLRPVTIVALGSSSTSGAGASVPAQAYPARLEAALRAARPGLALRVVNRGVGGQDAPAMAARIEAEVLPERPDLVIWQAGANGALRRADPERFRASVAAGLARLREAGAEVVLMDNQRAPRITAAAGHERFDAALAGFAGQDGVTLFSRGRLMDAWAAAGTPVGAMLVPDGLHHNDQGYACLAAALAEALLAEPY